MTGKAKTVWTRTVLTGAILLTWAGPGQAPATPIIKRSLDGVSTGMTLDGAWAAAVRAGGKCVDDSGRSSASPAFSCAFDRSVLVVGKTNYMDEAQVTRLTFLFLPSKLGKDLPAVLREQLDVEHEVAPDGRELTSWQRLKSGEAVKASCDQGMLPGNIPSPGRCQIEVTNEGLMAADRQMGARRHWLPAPRKPWHN